MEKKEFTKLFAQHTNSTSAAAADEVDRVVTGLLRRLRAGQSASLPGLGTLKSPDALKVNEGQMRRKSRDE